MTRIVFLNGDYVPAEDAKISIFDRAVNFGDGIYEVAGVLDGKLVDFGHHMQRYFNSLDKLDIEGMTPREAIQICASPGDTVDFDERRAVFIQLTNGTLSKERPYDASPSRSSAKLATLLAAHSVRASTMKTTPSARSSSCLRVGACSREPGTATI